MDLRGFLPLLDLVYSQGLANLTVGYGLAQSRTTTLMKGLDLIQMRPLSSDCLEINRAEPGGSCNLPAQRQKLQREQCLTLYTKMDSNDENLSPCPQPKNIFSQR